MGLPIVTTTGGSGGTALGTPLTPILRVPISLTSGIEGSSFPILLIYLTPFTPILIYGIFGFEFCILLFCIVGISGISLTIVFVLVLVHDNLGRFLTSFQ